MTRRTLLATTSATLLRAQRQRHPNLLFILADTWRGVALPSIDFNLKVTNLARLAREGTDCRRTYTSYAVCCPSRAAILTGRFPRAAGVTRNHTLLPLAQPTTSAALKQVGYRTGYIGKWHLDGGESPGFVPLERRRGFDYWAATNVQHKHYGSVYFRDTAAPIPAPGFEPDHQTDLAREFISQQSSQPFYLYVSYVAPHAPYAPPPRHATYDAAALRLRDNVPKSAEAEARRNLAGYYGLCSAVDECVGRLLATLDERGLAEETIVVFTSDHGETLGSHRVAEIDLPYEEVSRIPLLLRYPRRIRAGTTIDALVSAVDFAPTLLSLCEAPAPRGMQGANLSNVLSRGGGSTGPIFCEGGALHDDQWRMVVREGYKLVTDALLRPTQLFNLKADPYELENRVGSPSERHTREQLQAVLQRWEARTG